MILNNLLSSLMALGEAADEAKKVAHFETAVIALNDLNDDTDGSLIETDEREELCDLFNKIGLAAGIDVEKYGDGEGLESEWRDW